MAAGRQESAGNGGSTRSAADRDSAAKETAQRLKVVLGVLLMMAVSGLFVLAVLSPDDNSTAVPPPTSTERADTVTLLERAHAAQQICYGWRLHGDSWQPPVSVGSNLGDNVAVDSDPVRCPRWVEVTADIDYASSDSEASDSASYRVNTSPSLANINFDRGLDRLGVDPDQFVDEPGWAVCRAAVFLPLLVSEAGAAPAPPVASTPAAAQPAPAPLADPGNDFWRDRWILLLGAGGVFLLTALFLAIGWFERRHQIRPADGRRW